MTSSIMAGKILPILCLASTIIAQGLKPLVYEGCFTSAGDMTNAGSNQYQTPGLCQQQCVNLNKAVMGTHNGADCYCGDLLPSASDKTSEGSCNVKCNGYGTIMCQSCLDHPFSSATMLTNYQAVHQTRGLCSLQAPTVTLEAWILPVREAPQGHQILILTRTRTRMETQALELALKAPKPRLFLLRRPPP